MASKHPIHQSSTLHFKLPAGRTSGLLAIFLLCIVVMASGGRIEAASPVPMMNTFTILDDIFPATGDLYPYERQLLKDDRGVFNVALFSEKVTASTPLYRMFSRLPLKSADKKALLQNITDGVLKIYFDLGARPPVWNYNRMLFERELASYGIKELCTPPDFVIISHAHLPNYIGGFELMQKYYPNVPVFITEDMKEGLIYFDSRDLTGRRVKARTPIVLHPGETVLTDHLSIINGKYRKKWENVILDGTRVVERRGYKKEPEYENVLKVKTREGLALFATCMHCKFPMDRRNALYVGGFEEEPEIILKARKLSPSLRFYLYHCGNPEYLSEKLGGKVDISSYVKRIRLGETVFFKI
ncbi:MAG: hypothetical protein RDV48_05365 [Candidatus Eremiobacteraeota bacterium]|nr:hypothetical protein [Candidatus Eremiobacteraeota bacterium]